MGKAGRARAENLFTREAYAAGVRTVLLAHIADHGVQETR